jgi:selenophosphate synthetase-related protein
MSVETVPNIQHEINDPSVMDATPVVSVLMITYNHGPYIAEAIEGVVSQKTSFPIELIIGRIAPRTIPKHRAGLPATVILR